MRKCSLVFAPSDNCRQKGQLAINIFSYSDDADYAGKVVQFWTKKIKRFPVMKTRAIFDQ